MSPDEAEDDLRLELLRADHRYLIKLIDDLDRKIRLLNDHRRGLEQQLADNERQWK